MKGFEDKNKKLSVPWDLEFAKFKEIAVGLAYNDKYDQEWDNYNRWQQEDIQNKGLKCITYQSEVARHKLTFTLFFVNNKLVKAEDHSRNNTCSTHSLIYTTKLHQERANQPR